MPPRLSAQKQKAANEKRVKTLAAKKAPAVAAAAKPTAATSKKRKLEDLNPNTSTAKTYVYIVVWEEYDPRLDSERPRFAGTYASLTDANNRIMEVWHEWELSQYFEEDTVYGPLTQSAGVEKDGRVKWEAGAGEGARAWIEKQEVIAETGAEARAWGKHRPCAGYLRNEPGSEVLYW